MKNKACLPALLSLLLLISSILYGCSQSTGQGTGEDIVGGDSSGVVDGLVQEDSGLPEIGEEIPDIQVVCRRDSDCAPLLATQPPCTILTCSDQGECLPASAPDGAVCTAAGPCGGLGTCGSGLCEAEPLTCDDGNPCTEDSCDPESGCVNLPQDRACDDGNPCTVTDSCVEGLCEGTGQLDCDDGNPCTQDSCDPWFGCLQVAIDGECDDGDACTEGDHCVSGICTGLDQCQCRIDSDCHQHESPCEQGFSCDTGVMPHVCVPSWVRECPSPSPCLAGLCDAYTGDCLAQPVDDGLDCTDPLGCVETGTCQAGQCVGEPVVCESDNPCLTAACVPQTGCVSEPLSTLCDDGDPCSVNDVCIEGQCLGLGEDCQQRPAFLLRITSLQVRLPYSMSYVPGPEKLARAAVIDSLLAAGLEDPAGPMDLLVSFRDVDLAQGLGEIRLGAGPCARSPEGELIACPEPAYPLEQDLSWCLTSGDCQSLVGVNSWPGFKADLASTPIITVLGSMTDATIQGIILGLPGISALDKARLSLFIPQDSASGILIPGPDEQGFTLEEFFQDETPVQQGSTTGWWLRFDFTALQVPADLG